MREGDRLVGGEERGRGTEIERERERMDRERIELF